ncbi:MAG: hypothetical protein OEZ38_01095 [Gammaproteobacteria bacterium]|nr:hypothetical protein [Gammaproteobacteria bacterium]
MKMLFTCLISFLSYIATSNANGYEGVDKLKTLFTTPFERQQLDAKRSSNAYRSKDNKFKYSKANISKKVKVKGMVKKSNGEVVVWVNKSNTLKSSRINNQISVNTKQVKSEYEIPIKVNNRKIKIKPGQVWLSENNKVKETYQDK